MINKILPRKLNSSADSRVSDPSDMRDAVNVSSSDDFREGQDGATGNSGVLKPIKSNIELGNSLFVEGDTLRVIGKAICNKHNVIYFFVCDETTPSESGVYAYDPDIYFEAEGRTPDNIVKIFTSASFGFQSDSFVKADLTYVQKKFQERETTPYLFFTDNLSEPKKLNVLRAYYESEVNEYAEGSPEEIDFITACPVTPSMPPTAAFTGSGDTGSTNEFINVNGFQFAYQLIYRDGNESAISTYSDIAVPGPYINQGTDSSVDVTAFDVCNVSIPSDHISSEVETVRIIARRGNDGAWQTIHEEEDPDTTGFVYAFKNNTVDTSVPTEDIQKQFTNLPKKAYTQTIIGDRVFYGNYVEGFDDFPVNATIVASPQERPLDGLSYEINVEPATCVGELDEFLRNARATIEDAEVGASSANLDAIFNYQRSVNKNIAFRVRANELPEEIPVGRTVNLSFSFKPEHNFHVYQARNNAGYHLSNQLGDYFGPTFGPPTGEGVQGAIEKTRHYMIGGQYKGDGRGVMTPQGTLIHPPDPLGSSEELFYTPISGQERRRFSGKVIPDLMWQTPTRIAAAHVGTSAATPFVVPFDSGDSLNVSVSMQILDIRQLDGTEDGPSFVGREELILAVSNYISKGSVDPSGDTVVSGSSYTFSQVFLPFENPSIDENGWFQDVTINRGLVPGDEFSPTGPFANTITLCGIESDNVVLSEATGPIDGGDIKASSAVTMNSGVVRFRFFKDESYKRPMVSYNEATNPDSEFFKSISGEGLENEDQRIGLYIESITNLDLIPCLRLPNIGSRWKVTRLPQTDEYLSLHEGDSEYLCDPATVFDSTSGPLVHCIGRPTTNSGISYDSALAGGDFDFDGDYELPANLYQYTALDPSVYSSWPAIEYDPTVTLSGFTVVDGATYGNRRIGSENPENSLSDYDNFPVTTQYINAQDGYSELVGAYLLGTAPFVHGISSSLNPTRELMFGNSGNILINGTVASPLISNQTGSSGPWNFAAGSASTQGDVAEPLAAKKVYPVFPNNINNPLGSNWVYFSKFGGSPTDFWHGWMLAAAQLTEVSSEISFDGVDGLRSFKSSAHHGFGIVYYDARGRANSVKPLGEMYSPGYYSRTANVGSVGATITLAHEPPSWASYFQIVYTGNTTYSDFVQYTAGGAFAVGGEDADKGNIFVSLNYLQENTSVSYTGNYGARNVDGSDIMYTPQPGDILRIISYYDDSDERVFPSSDLSFEVVEYRKLNRSQDNPFFDDDSTFDDGVHGAMTGDFVVIRNNPDADGFSYSDVSSGGNDVETTSHKWNNKTIIEICRPTDAQAEENQVFYESSAVYPVTSHDTPISFNKGDVWFRRVPVNLPKFENQVYTNLIDVDGKGNPNFVDYYLETKAFNDKVRDADVWSKGKVKVQNPDEHEVRREASITFSDKNNPASKFLRLTSFSPSALQFKDMPLEHGAINYLVNQQDSILSIQKNKTASIPFNRNIISTAAGQDSLVASSSVLGTEVYYAGKYGCDDNPESVCEIDGVIYFASKSNAEVYRFTPGSGIQVISDAGMKSFFRNLFKRAEEQVEEFGPVKVVGGYDPLKKEFLLSVYNFNEVDEGSSVDFDSDPQGGDGPAPGTTVEVLPQAVTVSAADILERIPDSTRSDINNDGSVSVADLLIFLTEFGGIVPVLGDQTFTQDDDNIEFIYPE